MIKLINISSRTLDISKTVSILPGKHISGDIEITPRIHQLINMGLLKMSDIKKENNTYINNSTMTSGELRRKQVMENIKAGHVKPSIPLDNINTENIKQNNKKTKSKRNLKK